MFKVITAAAALQEKVVSLRRGDRLRRRLHRDRRRAHQRSRRVPRPHVPRRDRQVQRHRHDPRGAAPGPGPLQPLRARASGSARPHGGGAAGGVERAAPSGLEMERDLAGLMSFGQEVGVTALQMAMAISAVANGGYLMKPLIVRAGRGRQRASVERSLKPVAVRRVIDPDTVDTLTSLLKGGRDGGHRPPCGGPRVRGRGQDGHGPEDRRPGTLFHERPRGLLRRLRPASRPALVVLVSLDSPRGARNEGGDVAAPVFARVAEPRCGASRYLPTIPAGLRADPLSAGLPPGGITPDGRQPGDRPRFPGWRLTRV